jgi:excinuclease UvrABC helicase subunit UvrB
VHRHAQRKEDRTHLEQWRPYILRMNTIARAMLEADQKAHDRAVKIVHEGIEKIENLPEMDDETFRVERERSIEALRETLTHLEHTRPVTELERLNRELRQAIEAQEFERAALLRDRIRALRPKGTE